MRRVRLAPVALAVLASLLLAGCGGGSSAAPGATADLKRAAAGLCDVRRQASFAPSRAGATFYDRSHAALHEIARRLEVRDRDRPAAARLLEAMQQVEADLAASPAPPSLADDVVRLVAATRAGLDALSVAPPACMRP